MRALTVLRRRIGYPRLWLAGLLVVALLLPGPAAAANRAEVTETTITITVPIDLYRGSVEGDPAYFVHLWTAAINIWWNREGNHFGYTCPYGGTPRSVVFRPDIKVAPPFRGDAHVVGATGSEFAPPGQTTGDVHWPGEWEDYDPTEDTASGHWPEDLSPYGVAHEFGHILGLPDEYVLVKDPDGRVRIRPKPDYRDGSIMASLNGEVLQRHINTAVENHLSADQLGCSLPLAEPPAPPGPDGTQDGAPGPGGEPGAGIPPTGPGPDSGPGGGPPSGGSGPDSESTAGPGPDPACELRETTLYYGALLHNFDTNEVNCTLTILGCPGLELEFSTRIRFGQGQRCPWFAHTGVSYAGQENGPKVCCDALRRCPGDLDCDGLADEQDGKPLDPSNGRPRGGTMPRLEGLVPGFLDLLAPRLEEACPLLRAYARPESGDGSMA